jgi:peptidoglycan/xylan/chitin deacetylase (PgdA/CDA1 family)
MNKLVVVFLLWLLSSTAYAQNVVDPEGAIVRTDTSRKHVYLCFTGHDYAEGFEYVLDVLRKHKVKGSFFLTGDFVRNHEELVRTIADEGHYVGAHSDKHLLYCDWTKRDSLLHPESVIRSDIQSNLEVLDQLEIYPAIFMPPYEWYNRQVVDIAARLQQTTVNFSPGTRSNADYTTPDMPNYLSSDTILESIYSYLSTHSMNGFHLLIHPGTSPARTDKFYYKLDELITRFKEEGYGFGVF